MKTLILSISFLFLILSSNAQELKTFRGYVEFKFQLSHASGLTEEKKASLRRAMKPYSEKEALLTDYFNNLNNGDTASANLILRKDKFFKNKDDFTIAYMFSLARMQKLNELFRPCIQIYDEMARGIIITCTKDQFADLTDDDTHVFEITCRYVGELYVDKVKLYEMVRYR